MRVARLHLAPLKWVHRDSSQCAAMRKTSRGSAGAADARSSAVIGTGSFRYATRGGPVSNVTTPISCRSRIPGWALGHITGRDSPMVSVESFYSTGIFSSCWMNPAIILPGLIITNGDAFSPATPAAFARAAT